MKKKVFEYIQENNMIRPGESVLIGVSGGADSVCLLYLLIQLKAELGIGLSAVHVHHGLRAAEADRDELFVKELCNQWEVPCFAVHKDVRGHAGKNRLSLEDAGRALRYQVFGEYSKLSGSDKVAVAHHQGDQAETVLHHLFRGSGLKGLGGIAPVRGKLIRPFLCCNKEEIINYLSCHQIPYCIDSTNQSDQYTRNRLRNVLMPAITSAINPAAEENIIHAAALIKEADEYLEEQAQIILDHHLIKREDCVGIKTVYLETAAPIIQKYLIKALLYQACKSRRDLTFQHVSSVLSLIDKQVGKKISLPYEQMAWKDYNAIWIEYKKKNSIKAKRADDGTADFAYREFLCPKPIEIPKNKYTKWFDCDKIKGALTVRFRQTGDYFQLPAGGRKSVKSYMIDEKIPRERREEILLLAEGSHILWIVGYRMSDYYKVTEQTTQILEVRYDGGQKDEG